MIDTPTIVTPHIITAFAIGEVIQALFIGGLLVLGVTCLFLLSQQNHESTTQWRLWQVYITVLMLANLGFLGTSFLWLNYLIKSITTRLIGERQTSTILSFAGAILIASLTDGVLVSMNLLRAGIPLMHGSPRCCAVM